MSDSTQNGARDDRMEQLMSAKRHQIPQMEPVKADRERGEQRMEHRSEEWSRGPRDVEQLLTESGMAAQMRSIARQTEETAFVFFFPLHRVIHLLN